MIHIIIPSLVFINIFYILLCSAFALARAFSECKGMKKELGIIMKNVIPALHKSNS